MVTWPPRLKALLRDTNGNVLMMTGLALILLFAVGGSGVDYGRQQLVRMKIQQASDAAALAAASVPCEAEPCTERLQTAMRYYNLNYPEKFLGVTRPQPTITAPLNGPVTVSANADIETQFISNLGIPVLESKGRTVVSSENQGSAYDIVMLLDNSNSMEQRGKIAALKTAATTLADSVLSVNDDACAGDLQGCSRVALIPYSNRIPARAQDPSNSSECYCMCGSGCMGDPNGGETGGGSGCTMTRPGMALTDLPVCCAAGVTVPTNGCVVPCISTSPNIPPGCTPHGTQISQCYWVSDPNLAGCKPAGTPRCPPCEYDIAQLVPLTPAVPERSKIRDGLNAMVTGGTTDSSIAFNYAKTTMGYLPSARSEADGVAKVVIWLTDGNNTAYGGTCFGLTEADDERCGALSDNATLPLCEQLKSDDTIIYTIGFDLNNNPPASGPSAHGERARTLLRACATSPAHYFEAPDNATLQEIFATILDGIKKIRITE